MYLSVNQNKYHREESGVSSSFYLLRSIGTPMMTFRYAYSSFSPLAGELT